MQNYKFEISIPPKLQRKQQTLWMIICDCDKASKLINDWLGVKVPISVARAFDSERTAA